VPHLLDVGKQEFLHFARFVFISTQVLHLDAQQRYFPPHYRYWIGHVRIGRRGRAHEGMNVRSSGLIRHAQSVPKHGLQTINGTSLSPAANWPSCRGDEPSASLTGPDAGCDHKRQLTICSGILFAEVKKGHPYLERGSLVGPLFGLKKLQNGGTPVTTKRPTMRDATMNGHDDCADLQMALNPMPPATAGFFTMGQVSVFAGHRQGHQANRGMPALVH
jgi:hypothetical protein